MNCVNHPDTAASGYCRSCGKALCEACQVKSLGTIFCEDHKPMSSTDVPNSAPNPNPAQAQTVPPSPYAVPPYAAQQTQHVADASVNPGLAFLLGFVPGVGAIYNGQYAKGLVHVVVLGLLFTIADNRDLNGGMHGVFGLSIMAWFFYMAFEAYHTAKRRMMGEPVDEFSSLLKLNSHASSFPVGPIFLIVAGAFFLLANFDLIRVRDVVRFWPLLPISLGAYMLYVRMIAAKSSN